MCLHYLVKLIARVLSPYITNDSLFACVSFVFVDTTCIIWNTVRNYFAKRGGKYCDNYVCLFVCLFAHISQKPRGRTSPIFLCMLHVAVARFSFAMSYAFPVLWMSSCFIFTLWITTVHRSYCQLTQKYLYDWDSQQWPAVTSCVLFSVNWRFYSFFEKNNRLS